MEYLDTFNAQMVGVRGDVVVVSMRMTAEEAIMHAARLVAVADPSGKTFAAALEAAKSA